MCSLRENPLTPATQQAVAAAAGLSPSLTRLDLRQCSGDDAGSVGLVARGLAAAAGGNARLETGSNR